MTFDTRDLPTGRLEPQRVASARLRVVIVAAAGACAASLVMLLGPWEVALLAGLLSYLFGTVVIATMINLVAGLTR